MVLSEQTKELSKDDIELLKDSEVLEPDMMGFWGKEGIDDGSED